MHKRFLGMSGLLVIVASTAAIAQGVEDVPDRPIARAEVIAGIKRQFARLDANHDGVVSHAEFDAFRQRNAAAADSGDPFARVGAHWFEHADADGDGRVTMAEAAARPLELFDTADIDHDGIVSVNERKMAMMLMSLRGK